MTTAPDIRAWANANGHDIGDRGNIPRHVRAAYDAAHNGGSHPDYPDDDFESAFADMPDDDEPAAEARETPPRRPKAGQARKPAGGGGWFTRKSAGKKRQHPRMSTEDLLGSFWRGLAKMATPLPPLHRTLRVQAPVAGMLLEESVKGTVVDTLLQPLVRYAERGKAASALFGPPVLVTAISVHLQRAQLAGREPSVMFMSTATEMLRGALMTWAEVAGPKFKIAVEREKKFEEEYGQSVDDFIAMLFAAPADPADADAVRAEEEAIRRAQGIL
jgi:Lsr2